MLKRRSKVSTRFVLYTAIIYSVIIIMIVFSFLYILKINSNILREIVLKNNDAYFIKKVGLIIDRLKEMDIESIKELSEGLKSYSIRDSEFLYILIFSKTPDENFFKIQKKIPLDPSIKIAAERNKHVQEKKDINYLKTGLLKPVIDPVIYSSNNQYYKSVYHPFIINNKNFVIEFIVSSSEVINALNDYSEKINNIKKYSIIVTACAVISVIIITLLFVYNFSLLIKNLSGHLKKAAEGSLDTGIDTGRDDDINELAYSFNSIVSELKLKKDSSGDLFKIGVDFLKEENFDDAIGIFKAITIIKPGAFGSYFNLGVAYAKKRQYNLSFEMFKKALNSNPGHELALDYIAKIKRMMESQKANETEPSKVTG